MLRDLANCGQVDDAPSAVVRTFLALLSGIAIATATAIYTCPIPRGPGAPPLPTDQALILAATYVTLTIVSGTAAVAIFTTRAPRGSQVLAFATLCAWLGPTIAFHARGDSGFSWWFVVTAVLFATSATAMLHRTYQSLACVTTAATSHLGILVPSAASLQLSAISFAAGIHLSAVAFAAFSLAATVWLYCNGHETVPLYPFPRTLGAWASAFILTFASLTLYLAAPLSGPHEGASNEQPNRQAARRSGRTWRDLSRHDPQTKATRIRQTLRASASKVTPAQYNQPQIGPAQDLPHDHPVLWRLLVLARQGQNTPARRPSSRAGTPRRSHSAQPILVNSRIAGRPEQSLGSAPVNKTQCWHPGDNRDPVAEVLTYRIPAAPVIQQFDEAVLRFELRLPRRNWSAKIAIDRFRLIP